MAGELGPAHPPDRQRIGAVAGRVLLAKPAPPYRLVQRRGEIRPAPVFQLGADRLGERREGGQREIRCRHLFPPQTAGPCRGKRAVDLGELRRRQVPLPARRARHLAAAPHAGAGHRPDLRHVTPRSSLCSGLLLPRLYRPRINRLAPEISSRTSTIRRNAWSSSLPNSCSPAQVPTASAGRPLRNNTSVSWPTMPAPPR